MPNCGCAGCDAQRVRRGCAAVPPGAGPDTGGVHGTGAGHDKVRHQYLPRPVEGDLL